MQKLLLIFEPRIDSGASKAGSFAETSGIKRGDAMEWCSTGVPAQLITTNDIRKDELLTTDAGGSHMKRAIALLLLCEFLSTGRASAQAVPAQARPPQQAASPIEVTAQPEHGAPGTPVTIQGTVAVKGSNAVTINVKPPSGAPFSHTVSPDANGAFTLQYPDTKASGTYSVQATMGASSAAATFGIGSTDIAQNTIQQVQELLLTADSLVREGKRQYDGNRAVADAKRAATDQQIAQLQDYIAQAKKLWTASSPGNSSAPPTLADMLLEITAQVQSRPDLAARYAPALNQLQAWSEQSKTSLQRFKSREPLLKSMHSMNRLYGGMLTPVSFRVAEAETEGTSRGGAGTCESVQQVGEFFEIVGSILSLAGTPLAVGLNLAFQYHGSTLGAPTGIPVGAHGVMAATEVAEWQEEIHNDEVLLSYLNPGQIYGVNPPKPGMPTALKVGAAGIAVHLAAKLTDTILQGLCDEFNGNFSVTMHAMAQIYDHTWWKFTVEMSGTVKLLVDKGDITYRGAMPFVGQFEGTRTKFTVWEDAVPVLYKHLFQRGMTVSWHKVSATRVTNLTLCTDCVVPLRGVAVASEDFGSMSLVNGSLIARSNYPAAAAFGGETASTNPGGEDSASAAGVSGEPTNVGVSLLPGLRNLLPKLDLNVFSAAYFRIPVEGEIDNGKGNVSLTVLRANPDWDPDLIVAHVKYLVLTTGLGLGVPLLLDIGLPYPPAEFILKRALGYTTPGPAEGNTTIEMKNATSKRIVAEANGNGNLRQLEITFHNNNNMPRTKVNDADNNKFGQADYTIDLSLANELSNPEDALR